MSDDQKLVCINMQCSHKIQICCKDILSVSNIISYINNDWKVLIRIGEKGRWNKQTWEQGQENVETKCTNRTDK